MGGFGLKFFRGIDPGDIDDGNIEAIFTSDAVRKETNCLDERKTLVVADCTADFDDMDIGVFGGAGNFFLDEVGKMRDELDGFAAEAAGAFFVD